MQGEKKIKRLQNFKVNLLYSIEILQTVNYRTHPNQCDITEEFHFYPLPWNLWHCDAPLIFVINHPLNLITHNSTELHNEVKTLRKLILVKIATRFLLWPLRYSSRKDMFGEYCICRTLLLGLHSFDTEYHYQVITDLKHGSYKNHIWRIFSICSSYVANVWWSRTQSKFY